MADRMKRRTISDDQKNAAVARILSKKADAKKIADELGVSEQAVRAWVRERKPAPKNPIALSPHAKGAAGDPAVPAAPSNSAAPGAPPATEKSPLDRAQAAAGVPPGGTGPAALPSADQLRALEQADRELVIQTAIDLKTAGLKLCAAKAGLEQEDPDLKKISGLTPIASTALQANASWIAPIIRERVQGKLALVVALGIEAIATLSAFKAILEARGLIKKKDQAAADGDKKDQGAKA